MSASTYIQNIVGKPSYGTGCPKRLGTVSVTTMEELLIQNDRHIPSTFDHLETIHCYWQEELKICGKVLEECPVADCRIILDLNKIQSHLAFMDCLNSVVAMQQQ